MQAVVAEIFHFQTSAMGRVGCAGYVVGLRQLCGRVAPAMWTGCAGYVVGLRRLCGGWVGGWVTIRIIMPLCGPILQAESC